MAYPSYLPILLSRLMDVGKLLVTHDKMLGDGGCYLQWTGIHREGEGRGGGNMPSLVLFQGSNKVFFAPGLFPYNLFGILKSAVLLLFMYMYNSK